MVLSESASLGGWASDHVRWIPGLDCGSVGIVLRPSTDTSLPLSSQCSHQLAALNCTAPIQIRAIRVIRGPTKSHARASLRGLLSVSCFECAESLQKMGDRAEYIRIASGGRNALDFHIAFYVGKIASAHSAACFQIVSRDTGFDPLIAHLQSQQICVRRIEAVEEVLSQLKAALSRIFERKLPTSRPMRWLRGWSSWVCLRSAVRRWCIAESWR